MNISKEAKLFIKKYHLNKNGITIQSVTNVAISMGYEVIYFNPGTIRHLELLKSFGVESDSPTTKAITCEKDGKKVIFIVLFSSEDDKLYLLLHELAHLCLNHFYITGISEPEKEIQANEFAHHVMKYKKTKNIFTYAFVSVSVGMLLFGSAAIYNDSNTRSQTQVPTTTTQPTASSDESSEQNTDEQLQTITVAVTKEGDKYHLPDCHYITEKNSILINSKDAEDAGYMPCKICRPNEE